MGYYTELKGSVILKDLPDEHIKLIIDEDDTIIPTIPELKKFRECPRWSWIYLTEITENAYKVHADLKNYDGEIEHFWECIRPYYVSGFLHSQGEDDWGRYFDHVNDEFINGEF